MKKFVFVLMTFAFIQIIPIQKGESFVGPGYYWWYYFTQWCNQQGNLMAELAYECDESGYPGSDECVACVNACENYMACQEFFGHQDISDEEATEECELICGLNTM